MEFKIIEIESGAFYISDSLTVRCYTKAGKQELTGVPSKKLFREMAYILPPRFLQANSFEEAKDLYIKTRGEYGD